MDPLCGHARLPGTARLEFLSCRVSAARYPCQISDSSEEWGENVPAIRHQKVLAKIKRGISCSGSCVGCEVSKLLGLVASEILVLVFVVVIKDDLWLSLFFSFLFLSLSLSLSLTF